MFKQIPPELSSAFPSGYLETLAMDIAVIKLLLELKGQKAGPVDMDYVRTCFQNAIAASSIMGNRHREFNTNLDYYFSLAERFDVDWTRKPEPPLNLENV